MAITSTGYQSPATARVGLKPSVYDKIILIGPDETPIMSLIGTSSVKNIEHSWIIDTLAEPKKNAQLEISGFENASKSTKQKRSNAVQIFSTSIMISNTMKVVATYGGNELSHETTKKTKEHKRDIEFALLGLGRDSDVKKSVFKAPLLRDETTPAEMAGLFYYVSKGANAFLNGKKGNVLAFDDAGNWSGEATELTEKELSEILQTIWDSGATPKDVFIGAGLKKAINKLASRQFGNEKSINTSVVSLDTDFGKVNFRMHRYLSEKYGLNDVLIAGDFSFAKNGLLQPTIMTSSNR
ncbi:MAG: DUF5309 family protein [Campylobacter sputorum]|uniref:SU10 major capsid protein n=1 Tax=Campylobacter sputorum TaxID=206 RepID=UPI001F40AFB8|nr:DUF5309 family protein [Campylobacter sputorum]ASM38499.1 hypothetical protein CSPARA_0929 [Campylobacter sputorum bv. paraureolyticus LMG 11764]MDY6120412.1 DUF5309 family protein [Campylobacter sputorum]